MSAPIVNQSPGIILPTVAPLGTEFETVADLVEHTSLEFRVAYLQEKVVTIIAIEIGVGVPGPLWCWIELSPFPTANSLQWPLPLPISAAYWAAIGGGGSALPPVAPLIEVGTGVPLTVHSFMLPWAIHSVWARLVVQTPVAAALPNAFWWVQALFSGGSK